MFDKALGLCSWGHAELACLGWAAGQTMHQPRAQSWPAWPALPGPAGLRPAGLLRSWPAWRGPVRLVLAAWPVGPLPGATDIGQAIGTHPFGFKI